MELTVEISVRGRRLNMLHHVKPVQVKRFVAYSTDILDFETDNETINEINDFIKWRDVIDIKMTMTMTSRNTSLTKYLVIYREDG